VPNRFDSEGLPIGMQIIGKHFDESTVLAIAYAYEQSTDWHKKKT
jgi:aspartyl-tRNA(Asn)/glutamyl-tRNA(Gln) amidotransferase subunit A